MAHVDLAALRVEHHEIAGSGERGAADDLEAFAVDGDERLVAARDEVAVELLGDGDAVHGAGLHLGDPARLGVEHGEGVRAGMGGEDAVVRRVEGERVEPTLLRKVDGLGRDERGGREGEQGEEGGHEFGRKPPTYLGPLPRPRCLESVQAGRTSPRTTDVKRDFRSVDQVGE